MIVFFRYKKFLNLCQRWPVDASKSQRDLGAVIRQRVLAGFSKGEASNIDTVECDRQYECLERLASDHYRQKYPRSSPSTALELDIEVLQTMTATETLKTLAEEEKSTFDLLKEKVRMAPTRDDDSVKPP